MGVWKPFSSSSYDKTYNYNEFFKKKRKKKKVEQCYNPNPKNFRIIDTIKIGDFLIVMINYPDVKNYEGDKILMFEGVTLEQLEKQGSIDPHFSNNKKSFSPIARFEPTERGWENACNLAYLNTDGWDKNI